MLLTIRRCSRSMPARRHLLSACLVLILIKICTSIYQTCQETVKNTHTATYLTSRPHPTANGPFEQLTISGFANTANLDRQNCEHLHLTAEIGIGPSIDLDDDLLQVAESINHPRIDYSTQPKGRNFSELVRTTWGRMAGSSVWLEKYGVFLTISRVYWYDKGTRKWSVISFIRAQIFDINWKHLPGYELEWRGKTIVFPRILDFPFPYDLGGCFFGPEDPRIIIEHAAPDAEPVVVFNMANNTETLTRSMFVHLPFSNITTELLLEPRGMDEKNWAPFFMPIDSPSSVKQKPSDYIHLVYDHKILRIVRCHLFSGVCSWVYQQPASRSHDQGLRQIYEHDHMRGGTNFEPIHLTTRTGLHSFVGFPRTHIESGCGGLDASYRPTLAILTTNGTHFWFDYMSQSLNLGHSFLAQAQIDDPCHAGRVLLANNIAYFDDAPGRDEMIVSFSVNDATVQVATLKGVRQLVESLPQFNLQGWDDSNVPGNLGVSPEIVDCSLFSGATYVLEKLGSGL